MAARAIMLGQAEQDRKKRELRQNRKKIRENFNLRSLPDSEFINIFRLTKECFEILYNDLAPLLLPSQRCTAIKPEAKVDLEIIPKVFINVSFHN